jgi:hypothetical protein
MLNKNALKSVSAMSIFALVAALGTQAHAHPEHDDDKDKGPRVEKTFDLTGFDGIEVVGVYDMDVTVGKAFSIEASGREKEMSRMTASVKNGVLVLETNEKKKRKGWGKNNTRSIDINITLPALNSLEITGIGNGEINGIDSDDFTVEVSGIGAMELNGRCGQLRAEYSGMGDLDAKGLKCKSVDVDMSGMGSASVYASEDVDADMSGMGSIDVYGSPKTVKKDKTFMSSIDIH